MSKTAKLAPSAKNLSIKQSLFYKPTLFARRILFIKQSLLLSAFFFSLSLLLVFSAQADRLESDSYVIQFGNFNMTAGEKSSASYKVTDTVGQTAPGPYTGSNYFIGSGFQYIYQIAQFRFSISSTAIDLGLLTAGAHNSANHNISISTRGAGGYQVFAYELRPLTHSAGIDTVADTTCDNADCDETVAKAWVNQNIGGFGFNISGDDVPADFINNNYFRQFADNSSAEPMQVVMSSGNIAKNRTATVTYKAGLVGTESAGNYQTGIVYVAVPGY